MSAHTMRLSPASATISPARATTAIEVRHQFGTRLVSACRQQFVKLSGVIPIRSRLAAVGLAVIHPGRGTCPVERICVLRDCQTESDFDPCPNREVDRLHAGDCRWAVTFRTQFNPLIVRCDDEGAIRCQDPTGDNAQAVAELRASAIATTCSKPAGGQLNSRPIFRCTIDPAAAVLDEVAAAQQLPDADASSGVARVVGQFLQN